MGLHLQFFRRAIPLEISTPSAVSRARDVWCAAAFHSVRARGAAGRARPRGGSVRAAQAPYEAASSDISVHGTPPSFPIRHGGWTNAQANFFCRAGENSLPGPAPAENVARPADGWRPAAAFDSRRAGQSRRNANGQSPRQFKLHGVERNTGILREAM